MNLPPIFFLDQIHLSSEERGQELIPTPSLEKRRGI
jgi:hypothetical protein